MRRFSTGCVGCRSHRRRVGCSSSLGRGCEHSRRSPVQKTIELANNPGEEFAPPSANAAPKLTVQQPLDAYAGFSRVLPKRLILAR
jgi:hypothetical protein